MPRCTCCIAPISVRYPQACTTSLECSGSPQARDAQHSPSISPVVPRALLVRAGSGNRARIQPSPHCGRRFQSHVKFADRPLRRMRCIGAGQRRAAAGASVDAGRSRTGCRPFHDCNCFNRSLSSRCLSFACPAGLSDLIATDPTAA